MASYYDKRPYASDGHRSRSSALQREHWSRERSPDSSKARPDHRYLSARPTGSLQSSSRSASPRAPQPIQARTRRTWPPSPAVEDEKLSLAKESNASVADSDISDACSRGSVDQYPIIQEVEGYHHNFAPENHVDDILETGGVAASIDVSDSTNTQFRGRSESLGPELELPETPVFTRRAASPYVFNPKAPDASTTLSTDSGYSSDKKRDFATRADSPFLSGVKDDDDEDSTLGSQGGRIPAPYSYVADKAVKPGVSDFAKTDARPRLAEIKADALEHSPRRNSDSASNLNRPRLDNRNSAPYPAGFPPLQQPSDRSSTSRPDSRPSSPLEMPSVFPPSPPRSPRSGSYYTKGETPLSARSSISGSGSRPSSPVAGNPANVRSPEEGMRRSSTFPAVMDDRSQRTSRLAASSHVNDAYSPSPARMTSTLPYPVDDIVMPSEEDRRYKPRPLDDIALPRSTPYSSRPTTRDGPQQSQATSRPASLEVPGFRQNMQPRHSVDVSLPTALAATTAALTSPSLEPESPLVARASAFGPVHRSPARCFQYQSDRNFDGWFILSGCSNFDLCPACYDRHMALTPFANLFKPVRRRGPNPEIVCSLDTPWFKLAWRLTQQQGRSDLNLLYGVASVAELEYPCPEGHRDSRAWYTIYGKDGPAVHGFDVCPCDVKRIEALMPSLRGVFQHSSTSGRKRRCNLRTVSTRFKEYIDLLVDIDATATRRGKAPDMTAFVELARHKAQMRECSRDDLITDQGWHFASQLPEFTVCEECYSAIVWPAIASNSVVATRFKRTPELVDEDKGVRFSSSSRRSQMTLPGTSCQLYSDRMRQVFWYAVKNEDFNYLMRKAKDRKNMEVKLHMEFANINAELNELEKSVAKSNSRQSFDNHPRRLQLINEVGKISDDWRKWE